MSSYLNIKHHLSAFVRMGWILSPFKARIKKIKMRFEKATDQRKVERFRCQIEAAMISGRLAQINGRIKDVSIGGCLFRPASFFLVDRTGEEVAIRVGEQELDGKVVRTLPIGYAVQFGDLLTEVALREVLSASEVEASLFAKSQEDETRETKLKAQEEKSHEVQDEKQKVDIGF